LPKDEHLDEDSTSIFRLYEQHRNSTELSKLTAGELESCSQALKSMATSWSVARIKPINRVGAVAVENGGNCLAPVNDDGLTFKETDKLERLSCLKNRLAVLLGCFDDLPKMLTDFETQLGENFPSSINSGAINILLLNRFKIMNDEEIVLRHLLSAADVLRKGLALLEDVELSASNLRDDLLNSRFTPRVLDAVVMDAVSSILLRGRDLASAAVEIARSNEKNWVECASKNLRPAGHRVFGVDSEFASE